MKKTLLTAFLFFGMNSIMAQSPGNSLNFDGTDDYVSAALPTVFNDLASNDFTLETWISHEGTGTHRVFYAQLNNTEFASIIINSSNSLYTYVYHGASYVSASTSTTLAASTWTHVAMTWDASTLELLVYLDGVLATTGVGGSSTPSNDDNAMTLGVGYAVSNFDGDLDEFRIWDVVRTECQIANNMNSEFTSPQANLVTYYNFNQGVAGGANAGITTLPDFTTSYDGTLNNFDLSGASSNWVASGATIGSANGISSVTQTGAILTANESGAIYQWLDCDDNNSIISGETNQTFTPALTGNYSVEVNFNGCIDTSYCFLVDYTGIDELIQSDKELIMIIDLMGRETKFKPNTPLIYIYTDGTRERVMKIED